MQTFTYIYILLMFTMPYLFVTSENLVTYFILYIEACKICLVNSIFNSSCWFYNMYWKWNCFDVVAKEKKCLRKTLLYQQFRSMNKRNSSVWTVVYNHYFSFFISHLQIVYFSSAVLWFYLIQTKQEWMNITFAHQEKDSCGNKASWPWQWVNNSCVWILLRQFIIRPEKCTYKIYTYKVL